MAKKQKTDKKYIILIILVILAIILGIISSSLASNRKLTPVEALIKDSVLYINKIINIPLDFIIDKIDEANAKDDIYHKYTLIKKQLDNINLNNAKMLELETELARLEQLLKLNSSMTEYEVLNANVINRNIGYWYNNLTLDKGSNSGIKLDMAVITPDGLIGKITQVTSFTSTVKLLTSEDINNKVSVKIKTPNKDIYGLISSYDKNNNLLIIDGISDDDEIPFGSTVVTTGLGGVFPSGLLVGTVSNTGTDNFELAKTVSVKSLVDFNDISYVSVLKRAS